MWDTLAHPYLSVLLRGLDHVHVHIVDQVGHLRHVLDDLVGLTRDVPLRKENKRTEEEITSIRYVKKKKKMPARNYIRLVSRHRDVSI